MQYELGYATSSTGTLSARLPQFHIAYVATETQLFTKSSPLSPSRQQQPRHAV
jgi:hypothetical protein